MRSVRHVLLECFINATIISLPFLASAEEAQRRPVTIAVNQYMHHANLQAVYDGFREVIDRAAVSKSWTVEYQWRVADQSMSTAVQIAQQQDAMRPDLVLALATPSAQASVKFIRSAPIVFGAITDPVKANLVESLERPGGNATGTSDRWPYNLQFTMMRQLVPNARVVGIPYNPGEANSVASMEEIEPAALQAGFSVNKASVDNVGVISTVASNLAKSSDVLFAPADNTVLSSISALVKVARTKHKPLFVGDEGSVKAGGVASYGINYHVLGKQTGEIAVRIIEGESAGSIPVQVSSGARIVANPEEAMRQGLTLGEEFLAGAVIVRGEPSVRP